MADPVTAIGLAATVAGGGVSAFSSILGGEAKKDMYNYQTAVAQINSKIAEQNADYSFRTGEIQAQQEGMKQKFLAGEIKANQGASGFDIKSGSSTAVRDSQQAIGEYDQALIRSNAAKQAYGYKVDAMNATAQGEVYRMAGQQAETAGILGGIGSLISTAGGVSDKWIKGRAAGLI